MTHFSILSLGNNSLVLILNASAKSFISLSDGKWLPFSRLSRVSAEIFVLLETSSMVKLEICL